MLFSETGHAGKGLYVTGLPVSACYLLDGKRPVLFDAGYTCGAVLYEEGIKAVLGRRQPEILFLTHVHYDHCGAAGYLKRVFPGLKVAASERAARIIERPNARKLMAELSNQTASFVSQTLGLDASKLIDEPFQPFDVDIILDEGDRVELDGLTVEVLASPGHTRDLLSYYIPERRILIGTETTGCQDIKGHIVLAPLVSYDAFLSSLERIVSLPADIYCQGHRGVWVGADDVQDFFRRAMIALGAFKEKAERLLREEQGSVERVMARIKAEEYDTNPFPNQPEDAYLINLRGRLSHLAERMKGTGEDVCR